MPAPGGAKPLVGTNPWPSPFPRAPNPFSLLDMATSEGALGKIRGAASRGEAIPATWAVTADGAPTTDPNQAIKGMLLPSGGPKGFALSFMIDMLSALLSAAPGAIASRGFMTTCPSAMTVLRFSLPWMWRISGPWRISRRGGACPRHRAGLAHGSRRAHHDARPTGLGEAAATTAECHCRYPGACRIEPAGG